MRRNFIFLRLLACALFSCASQAEEPIIQMLVPGFAVRELPLKISNLNNLRFAPDGTLTALGYDGRVHLLRDTNGDGLEDQDELFWGKPTITVPVGMCWSPEGLYVSSHGKVSLLCDTNADGKADVEKIIANGWPPTDVGSGGVDATAVTRNKDGNIYFGLLTADYSNAYRVKDGVSRYSTNGMRGTIQKWSPKTKQLETFATGIRVPYQLAFNKSGDLFVTDQEGETWCPDGNPLDELNHIIAGKNYGFPPRHDKWLPDLISESPVVSFGPQHQSTCGFVFNEPERKSKSNAGRALFGPKWWEGDAIVAGASRGKIWRVKLVKTPNGYVGKETIIARLSMMPMDVVISPKGDLYVCCHSGKPDWGTGPKGEGKIFKISYTDKNAPQPVNVWAAGQMEVRVAFDRAIDPFVTDHVAGKEIEFGEFVSAADRFETLKPPYKTVKLQDQTPRGKLKIFSARLERDQKTLVLSTAPHPLAAKYAVTISGVKPKGAKGNGETVDLDYDLSGVEISWAAKPLASRLPKPLRQRALNSGIKVLTDIEITNRWLPYPDIRVSEMLLGPLWMQSEDFGLLEGEPVELGLLKFRVEVPGNTETLRFSSTNAFTVVALWNRGVAISNANSQRYEWDIDVEKIKPTTDFYVSTRRMISPVEFSYREKGSASFRLMPPARFSPSWVPSIAQNNPLPVENPELVGGDFQRGKSLFFGDRLKCATCHRIRGEGNLVAPDLSNLVSRDAGSILRDIKEPNATLHPDYVAFNVSLKDGGDLNGFVSAQNEESFTVLGVDGKETVIARKNLEELRASSVSLMPSGLLDGLKETGIRDLLTFLTAEPPKRTRDEVRRIVSASREEKVSQRPLKIVWVASKQDHGPGEHDYPAAQKMWLSLLNKSPEISATNAWEWPSVSEFEQADVLVFYFWNHGWTEERLRQLDEFLAKGRGVVVLHSATISKNPERLAESIGLASQSGRTKYLHMPFDLKVSATNALTQNFPKQIHFLDEPYWPLIGDRNKITILATVKLDGKDEPEVWTFEPGNGRVFGCVPGHYTWTHEDPFYRILILRGIAWAGGRTDVFVRELHKSTLIDFPDSH